MAAPAPARPPLRLRIPVALAPAAPPGDDDATASTSFIQLFVVRAAESSAADRRASRRRLQKAEFLDRGARGVRLCVSGCFLAFPKGRPAVFLNNAANNGTIWFDPTKANKTRYLSADARAQILRIIEASTDGPEAQWVVPHDAQSSRFCTEAGVAGDAQGSQHPG